MRRLIALALFTLFAVTGVAAQSSLSYRIRDINYQILDESVVGVSFIVDNDGAAMTTDELVRLFNDSGTELTQQPITPQSATELKMELNIPLIALAPGGSQTLCVTVGMSALPPVNLRNQFRNIGCLTVSLPAVSGGLPNAQVTPSAASTPTPAPGLLPGINFNLSDPTTFAVVLGIAVVMVVLLWVFSVIFRMIFSRPPTLPAWQAPYVITPLVDPNSTNGRRQLWQQHAQSDTLPLPCAPGNYMVRKLLIGSNGMKLNGWQVTGLRVSQYDRYGRVARSQTVLPRKTVKALNRAARKSPSLDWEHAVRAVRPVARALAKALAKKSSAQNAILPIALDIRFAGMHGEVGILFELYGCNGGSWQEIDHWEPEMRVVNGSIQENFTYTVLGQQPQEARKPFRQRLESDLTNLLAAMVQKSPSAQPAPQPGVPTASLTEDTAENPAV